jgi:hypothetical protein
MIQQGDISDIFKDADLAGAISGFMEEIGDAITVYRVRPLSIQHTAYSDLIATGSIATSSVSESCGASL